MMRARAECGDVALLNILSRNVVVLTDPDAIRDVLLGDPEVFSKKTLGYDLLRRVLGSGLVTSEGTFWRRQRRIAQPAFMKKRLAAFAETMHRASRDRCVIWSDVASQGRPVDVAEEMMQLTLRIAGETLFSQDLSDDTAVVGRAVSDLMSYFNHLISSPLALLPWLPLPSNVRGRRALETLDTVVYDMILERRQLTDRPLDLLDLFMTAKDEETGEVMDDQQLRDEVVTMLTAGHETTANGLAWTFYLLGRHPEVLDRVFAELDERLSPNADATPNWRDLVYTGQVFQEAMRLYPPVWAVARRAEKDTVLCSHRIKRGSFILMSSYIVQRRADLWAEPLRFDPDRFSPKALAAAREAGRPKAAYFPFSLGPRKCIGDHFALMEGVVVLATLLSRFRPELIHLEDIEPEPSVTLRPQGGIWCRLHPR